MTAAPATNAQSSTGTFFRLLWKYRDIFLRHRASLAAGIFALLLTNVFGAAIPLQVQDAVNGMRRLVGGDASVEADIHATLLKILGLAFLMLIARVASRQFLLSTGRRAEYDLRNRLFNHLLGMPTDYYSVHPAGELMSRMTSDVDATKFLTSGGVMLGFNTLFAYIANLSMMVMLSPQLTVIILIMYPVVLVLMNKISGRVRQGFYNVQKVLADISTVAQENLNGMTVIQSYAKEEQESHRFSGIGEKYYKTYMALLHERVLMFMLFAGLSGLSLWLLLTVGGWQVMGGRLEEGGFIAFMLYLERIAWPTMALSWTVSMFQQGSAALQRLDEVFSAESALRTEGQPGERFDTPAPQSARLDQPLTGQLELRNLTFDYHNVYREALPDESNEQASPSVIERHAALRNINLAIRPGEVVAFVGPIGSGKSTLLRLLPRMHQAPEGTIFADGIDVNRIPLNQLRHSIVFMPQASFLFSSTVSHNIAFGAPEVLESTDAPDHSIIPAAQIANVHADIMRLPKQYQTLVGERGVMLSGGQRQRVSLARALMLDAPVLILDDPFSNVDAETERMIVGALAERKIFQGKTTLFATHRFSLLKLADRVVLMNAGEIVAVGSHQELLETQPLYQKLNRLEQLRENLGAWGMQLDPHAPKESGLSASEEAR